METPDSDNTTREPLIAHETIGDNAHAETLHPDSDSGSGTVTPHSDSGTNTPNTDKQTGNEAILQQLMLMNQQMNQRLSESQLQMQQWVTQQMSAMQARMESSISQIHPISSTATYIPEDVTTTSTAAKSDENRTANPQSRVGLNAERHLSQALSSLTASHHPQNPADASGTQATPGSQNFHSPGTQATPGSQNLHSSGNQATPGSQSFHSSGTQATPGSQNLHSSGNQATPGSQNLHTSGTQATPGSQNFHSSGNQATPGRQNLHPSGTQATPGSQNFHSSGIQATPGRQTFHSSGTQATPGSQHFQSSGTQATPRSQNIYSSGTQANPGSQNTHSSGTQATPGSQNLHPSTTQNANHTPGGNQKFDLEAQCRTIFPVDRRRLTKTAFEETTRTIDNIRPYVIKHHKYTNMKITMEESLRPTLPVARYDAAVRRLLGYLQNGAAELCPPSHKHIQPPYPSSKELNDSREKMYSDLHKQVTKAFTEHMDSGDEKVAIPLPVLHICIDAARQLDITNPIFMGQSIMKVVQEHPKTAKLWTAWKQKYTNKSGMLLPVHIIDLYTEAALARGTGHHCPHLRAEDAVERLKQKHDQTAEEYINEFFTKLKELRVFYDDGAEGSDYPNNSILATINKIPNLIFKHANRDGLLYKRMADDLDTDRKLPWKMWIDDTTDLNTMLPGIQNTYTEFARRVDSAEVELHPRRSGNRAKQRGHNKRSDKKSSAPSRKSNKSTTAFQTDPAEDCTSPYCKRKRYAPHKVGALDDCGRICGLKLRYGIECPTTTHEVGQRHFYRKGCKQAFDKFKEAKKVLAVTTDRHHSSTKTTDDIAFIKFRVQGKSGVNQETLYLKPDTQAAVTVIRPAAFELIRNLATPVGIGTISGVGDTHAAMYTVEWNVKPKPKRVLIYVADIKIAAHGVLGKDLHTAAGVKLQTITNDPMTLSDIVRTSDAAKIESLCQQHIFNHAKHEGPTVFTLCNGDDFTRIEQEFRTLVANNSLTQQAIEDLLRDVPQEEHPHGFDIEEALQQLLVMKKAVDDETEAAKFSEHYGKFLRKIRKYQELGKSPPELQKCHEECIAILSEYEDNIATKGKALQPLVITDEMKKLTHTVRFDNSCPPQRVRAIPLQPKLEDILDKWNQAMVASGRAHAATQEEIANAQFVCPHIPVLKRGATQPYDEYDYRFALNAIPANAAIISETPIAFPTRQEIRHMLEGKAVFSVIDLSKFFDNIPADYQGKILYLVKGTYYTYDVVIQGEKNAPHAAHQVTTHIFGDIIAAKKTIIHVDDILIATETTEEHKIVLRDIFERLQQYGLKINPAKCTLAQPMVRFLGMVVHAGGVEPDLLRYNSIVLWPDLTTKRKAEKFHGFILYFHQFIKDCSNILRPIQDAINSEKYVFSSEVKKAFYEAKAALLDTIELNHIDYNSRMHIHVDTATSNGIGAVLYQEIDGQQRPLLFQSRRLNAAEQNYSPTDAELCGVYWACTKAFHEFVQFAEIVIHTDHLNLKDHLSLDKATTKRRRRWCFYLGDYNIVDVVHEKGATFTDCDTLSRIKFIADGPKSAVTEFVGAIQDATPDIEELGDITFGIIRLEQSTDEFCQRMLRILDEREVASGMDAHVAQRMTQENGILHYTDILKRREELTKLIVVPESLRARIITTYHDQPAGHRGAHLTALTIRAAWWWPKMMQDIKNHVDSCEICNVVKASGNSLTHGTLSTMQPTSPNQIVTIDLYNVADLEAPSQGEPKIALTAIYNFTRYPCIIPLEDKSPQTVVRALAHIFAEHGTPQILFHDQGKEFEGAVAKFCKNLGIDNIRTAPRSPHSVGIVERLNEELKKELRRMRLEQPTTPWTMFLTTILHKLRSTYNSATGFTPYELTGIVTAQPRGATPSQQSLDPADFQDYEPDHDKWSQWISELARKRTIAMANDIQARDERLTKLNRRRRPVTFAEGDWVRIRRPSATKMAAQVSEPHQISQILDKGRKFLVTSGTTGKTIQASMVKLQHCNDPKDHSKVRHSQTARQQKPKSTKTITAALVIHTTKKTKQYKLVEWTPDAMNRAKVKVYTNSRPSAQPTQQKWKLTNTLIQRKELEVIDTFDFQVKKGKLVIPLAFRQAHRDVPILLAKARGSS